MANRIKSKDMTLLQAIKRVVELSEDSKMSKEFIKQRYNCWPRVMASRSGRLYYSVFVWRKALAV